MKFCKFILPYMTLYLTACSIVQETISNIAITTTIEAYPTLLYANNIDQSEITICIKSTSGTRLNNITLMAMAEHSTIDQPSQQTNAEGCLQAYIKSSLPGQKNIRFQMIQNNIQQELDAQAQITFVLPQQKNAVAGIPWFEKIKIEGNRYFPSVEFQSSDESATLPNPIRYIVSDRGEKIFSFTFRKSGTHHLKMLDSSTKRVLWQQEVIVEGGEPYKFGISHLPTSVIAGETYSFDIEALDLFGNRAKSFAGTFKIIDVEEAYEQEYTLEAYHQGLFNVINMIWKKQATHQLLIRSTTNTLFGTSATLDVLPSDMASLVLEGPAWIDVATPFELFVTTRDRFGNRTSQLPKHLILTTTDPQGLLPPYMLWDFTQPYPMTTGPMRMYTSGVQSITLEDSLGLVASASHTFEIKPSTTYQFVINTTAAIAGQDQTVTIQATDAFGNRDTSYQGSISILLSDDTAYAPSSYTFSQGDQGTKTFYFRWFQSGIQSIAVADTTNTTLQGQRDITVSSAEPNNIEFQNLPLTAQVGINYPIHLVLKDEYDNQVLDYVGQINLSSTDHNVLLSATIHFLPIDQGKKEVNQLLFKTAGIHTLTATETHSSITSISHSIAVRAGEPNHLIFLQQPHPEQSTCIPMTPAPKLGVIDSFGNLIERPFTITLGLANNPNKIRLIGEWVQTTHPSGTIVFPSLEIHQPASHLALKAELIDANAMIPPILSHHFDVQYSSAPSIEIQDSQPYAGCGLIPYKTTSHCPFRIEAQMRDIQAAPDWRPLSLASGVLASDPLSIATYPTDQQLFHLGWDVSADFKHQSRDDIQLQLKIINADGQQAQAIKATVPIEQQPLFVSDRIEEKSGKPDCTISIDIDNNGWPDLLSCGKNPMQLTAAMQHKGNNHFLDHILPFDIDIQPERLAEIHLGFDGYPDLVAVNNNGLVLFLQNTANNQFLTVQQIDLVVPIEHIQVRDYNHDGLEDVLLLLESSLGQFALLFQELPGQFSSPVYHTLGRAIKTFAPVHQASFPGQSLAFVTTHGIYMQSMDANGTFQAETLWKNGTIDTIAIGDIYRDGWDDIIGLDENRDHLVLLKNNTSGGFATMSSFALPSIGNTVQIMDINQDGYLDIAVAMQNQSIHLLLGNATMSNPESLTINSPIQAEALHGMDVYRNNTADIVVTNTSEQTVLLAQDNQHHCQWSIDAPRMYSNIHPIGQCQVVDWNQSGSKEIVTYNPSLRGITLSTLDYNKNIEQQVQLPLPSVPTLAQFADITGDQIADIVAYNQEKNILMIGLNADHHNHVLQFSTYNLAWTIDTILLVDIDHDSRIDILTGSLQTGNWQWWRNMGRGLFIPKNSFALPPADTISVFETETHHPLAKLILIEKTTHRLTIVEYHHQSEQWQLQTSTTLEQCDETLALVHTDLNQDGLQDITLLCNNHSIQLWVQHIHPTLLYHYLLATSLSSSQALQLDIGDLNQDGKKDILTAGHGFYRIFEQNEFPLFSSRTQRGPMNLSNMMIRDVNTDGVEDVLSCYQDQLWLVHYGDHLATLFHEPTTITQNVVLDYLTEDLNRDGWPDIAAVHNNRKDIIIAWNTEHSAFSTSTTFNVGIENIRGIGLADINQDGFLDLALCGLTAPRALQLRNPINNAYPNSKCDFNIFQRMSNELNFQFASTRLSTSEISATQLLKMNLIDINHDGLLDILFPYYANTFRASLNHQFQFNSVIPIAGHNEIRPETNNRTLYTDINQDGWVDIVRLSNENPLIIWMRNNMAGFFSNNGIALANDFEVIDINQDQWPDLIYPYTLNLSTGRNDYYNSFLKISLGSEYGFTHHLPQTIPTRFYAMESQVRSKDLNGDGLEDIFVTYGKNGGMGWSKHIPNLGMSQPISYWIGGSTHSPELIDLNRDGIVDVIVRSNPIPNAFNQTQQTTFVLYGR